jgi:hypothetical protein
MIKNAKYRPLTFKELLCQFLIASIASFLVLTIGESEPLNTLVQTPGFGRFWVKNLIMIWTLHLLIRYGRQWVAYLPLMFIPWARLLVMILILGVAYGLSALYFFSENVNFSRIHYFNMLFPLTLAFVLFINAYEWLFERWIHHQNRKRQFQVKPAHTESQRVEVYDHKTVVALYTDQIKWIEQKGSVLRIQTFEDTLYTACQSLRKMEEELLEDNQHFRITDRLIIHYRSIKQIEDQTNRRLVLKIDGLKSPIHVHERRVKDFKAWHYFVQKG